jgi:Protein of unknown function (DUF3768)
MPDRTATIALLNDLARTKLTDCRLVITQGIAAMADMEAVIEQVRSYTDFTPSNDPYGEHDFGSFEHHGQTVFWKFDYYDLDLLMHSPDPADQTVTCRVLTVMLAEEY